METPAPWNLPPENLRDHHGGAPRPPLDLAQIDVPLSGPPGAMNDPSDN